jgi:hypothetical protein
VGGWARRARGGAGATAPARLAEAPATA